MKTSVITMTDIEQDRGLLKKAGQIIRQGGLVAFPTETVYGLGANGLDERACKRIYEAKGRPSDNPLILTVPDLAGATAVVARFSHLEKALIERFWPGPLTLVLPRKACVPDAATGGLDTVALRCPDHAICQAFLQEAGVPVAGPSANRSTRPSPTTAAEVLHDMDGRIDMIIDGGMCHIGVESTIIECTGPAEVTILRPGGVTPTMLAEVAESVILDAPLVQGIGTPKAPGMKYRHYAPNAPMVVFVGTVERVATSIRQAYQEALAKGQNVGLLVSQEVADAVAAEHCYVWGTHGDVIALANQLYTGLLSFDTERVDVILAEGVISKGLGLAVMNRMKKAAGGHVIEV